MQHGSNSIWIHLHQRMSLTLYVTCPSPDTDFCNHSAWISATSAAEPTEEPADFWELEVGRILSVLAMKCWSATTSTKDCLLLVTAWTEKIWGRKWQQLSAHCTVLVFQSVQRWDLNLISSSTILTVSLTLCSKFGFVFCSSLTSCLISCADPLFL